MAKNKIIYNGNTLIDLTGDTVTADKLMQGYTAHDRSGTIITGTATQGGSVTQDQEGFIVLPPTGGGSPSVSGLVYESGTFTPSEETGYPTIPFAKNHDTLPTIISLTDIGEGFTPTGTNAVTVWQYYDAWKMAGHGFPSSSNTLAYSYIDIFYVSKSGGIGSTRVATSHNSSEAGSGAQYPTYYVSTTAFMPYTNGSRYYKAGRTYKWIAVWAPTT